MEILLGVAVVAAVPLAVVAFAQTLRHPAWILALYGALVPFGSSLRVPGIPDQFGTLSTLVGMLATGLVFAHLVLGGRRAVRIPSPVPAFVLLVAWSGSTLAWTVNPSATTESLILLTSLVSFYVVVALLDVSSRDLRVIEVGIVVGGAVVGFQGVLQIVTAGAVVGTEAFEGRLTAAGGGGAGAQADPNITAASLLLPLAVSFGRASAEGPLGRRAAWAAGATGCLLGIVLTASRGALLALAVVIFTLVVVENRRSVRKAMAASAVAGVVLLVVIAPVGTVERLFSTERGSSGRTSIWEVGVRACTRYCWAGSGLGTFPDVHEEGVLSNASAESKRLRFEAHDLWLALAVETGFVGLLLAGAGFFAVIAQIRRMPWWIRGPPLAAVAGVLTANIFLANLEFKYLWLVLAYGALVTNRHRSTLVEQGEPQDRELAW